MLAEWAKKFVIKIKNEQEKKINKAVVLSFVFAGGG